MAFIKNPWVGYLTRSHDQVKASVINRLKIACPEITDLSNNNLLIILVSIFAGIAEMLNYYIDNMAREAFIGTARRFSSMVKLVKLINYKITGNLSASVDITFLLVDSNGDPIATQTAITIPAGTKVSNSSGVDFLTTETKVIGVGSTGITIGCKQRSLFSGFPLAEGQGIINQAYQLPTGIEHGSWIITIDGDIWEYRDYLDVSGPTDQHYTVDINTVGDYYVVFGDGVKGAIPPATVFIYLTYFSTLAESGNLEPDTITTLGSDITLPNQVPAIDKMTVTNPNKSSGGRSRETVEIIRKLAPLSLRTLNRAVTRQDFIDIAKLAPGIDKASLHFKCGKKISIYISPIGGGIAPAQLCSETKAFIDERKTITTFTEVLPAGETYIGLTIEATGKFRVPTSLIESAITNTLVSIYSPTNSDINKPVRLSDLIALIDNLEEVDFLSIHDVYQVPYARPVSHEKALVWERRTYSGSQSIESWKLVFVLDTMVYGDSYFKLYKNGVFIKNINFGESNYPGEVPNMDLNFTILEGDNPGLTNNLAWLFKTYPYNQNLELDDFTVPVISNTYITLSITEQNHISNV